MMPPGKRVAWTVRVFDARRAGASLRSSSAEHFARAHGAHAQALGVIALDDLCGVSHPRFLKQLAQAVDIDIHLLRRAAAHLGELAGGYPARFQRRAARTA